MSEIAPEAPKKKIYCFLNTTDPGWMVVLALCEDGHCIASHVSSSESWARWDIGVDGGDWKDELYDAHCGKDGWELEWVETEDVRAGHAGLEAAYALNQELAAAEENHKLPLVGAKTRDATGEEGADGAD